MSVESSNIRTFKIAAGLGLVLCLIAIAYASLIWWVYLKDDDGTVSTVLHDGTPDIKITTLQDGFFVLEGAGGNITVSTGPDGVLLVETGDIGVTQSVLDALEDINATDVVYVINTHSHGDHRGGNATFSQMGAEIIAHRNARDNIRVDLSRPSGPENLPTIVFDDTYNFTFNGQDISLTYLPLAHTNGDILAFFEQANILATGDAAVLESLPFISRGSGATLDSHLAGVSQILSDIDDTVTVVPGHGPVAGRAELQGMYDHLLRIRNYMARLKSAGVPPRYLPLFHPLYAWPAEWRRGPAWEKFWIKMVYRK